MIIIPAPTRRGQRTETSRMPRTPEVKEIVRPPGWIQLLSWCWCLRNRSPTTPKMDGYAGNRAIKLRVELARAMQQVTRARAIQQSQNRHICVYGVEAMRIEMEHTKPVFVAPRMATPPPMACGNATACLSLGMPPALTTCTYRLLSCAY